MAEYPTGPLSPEEMQNLLNHLQTAVEIELSTIPIYLYTYYSINRLPDNCDKFKKGQQLSTFANMAGGVIMSVAVEEMLHMSLACNILKSLGGKPVLYGRSPGKFPTNLPHHKADFEVGLSKLTYDQLGKFLDIEKPENPNDPPQDDNWTTIGQFYSYIEGLIDRTDDKDYGNENQQLSGKDGYYAASNVDTIYPTDGWYAKQPENPQNPVERGARQANYPNNDDSGTLELVTCKKSAKHAIQTIMHQGEGFIEDPDHKFDDKGHNELSHYYKFKLLHEKITHFDNDELDCFRLNFPDNPTRAGYLPQFLPLVDLANAVYSYLLLITQISYTLSGPAQVSMFDIGMHKGMIFILDKLLGQMRGIYLNNKEGQVLAPTFEFYEFNSLASAKQELVTLAEAVPSSFGLEPGIIQCIKDLPDVNVGKDGIVHF